MKAIRKLLFCPFLSIFALPSLFAQPTSLFTVPNLGINQLSSAQAALNLTTNSAPLPRTCI